MSLNTLTTATTPELRGKTVSRSSWTSVFSLLERCVRVHAERRQLLSLDDRMLKDIGLSRGDVHREASRSVFDVPADGRRWPR